MKILVYSFQSEWLKTRRSASSWLTIGGGCLVPLIYCIARMHDFKNLYPESQSNRLWENIFMDCWQITNIVLLPLGVILVSSLVAQLEYRNNTWKQTMTTPQSPSLIFFVKMIVIMVMLLQFFIIFNIGLYLCGVVPSIIFRGIPFPVEEIPFLVFLKHNIKIFIDCLPVLALQYLLSIQFRNFLIPLGVGLGLYVCAIISVRWEYGYWIPYTYNMLNFRPGDSPISKAFNHHAWAITYFGIITLVSYVMFVKKKEKG
ncbi:MAG: ABC transporter permease [Bacteroidia bacterium]|nr:ABC transporter permease [Bacteroidia bacterium]